MIKVIERLQKYVSDGNNEDMAFCEEILAENLESASKVEVFFSLPFANICSVVKKSKKQNVKIIIDVILGLYESDHKSIPVLLDFLDLPELKLDECIQIISSFKSSPICVHTGNIYEEYSIRPEIDWEFTVSEKEKEISELKSGIEANQDEITKYNKLKDENQREITNLNGKIKDMQDEIAKLLKNNEEKQNKIITIDTIEEEEEEKEIATMTLYKSPPMRFKYDGNSNFSGIIKYLSRQCGENIVDIVDEGIVRVEASSTHLSNSSYNPKNVFEEGTNSGWLSDDTPNSWIEFDFIDKNVLLEAYSICASFLCSFKLDGSNDGINWVQIETNYNVQELNGEYKSKNFTVSTIKPFRFFKFTQTEKTWDHHYSFSIYQIEFFGSLISGIIKYLSSQCGGNVVDNGIVRVEASSTYDSDYSPINVFKENTNSNWKSRNKSNSWIKFDFIDKKVHLEAYSICAKFLRSFKLECSNDETNWVQIDTRNDVKALFGNTKSETFTVSPNMAFRFFRFTQTCKTWNYYDIFTIYQIEFFGSLIQ